mmetsp:Transcript_8213/g.18429  ORF Transcript_8213/g.18429 Transcript_8213/m.18429 type:complete len:218 (+) Transcript_8213:83-736(+)
MRIPNHFLRSTQLHIHNIILPTIFISSNKHEPIFCITISDEQTCLPQSPDPLLLSCSPSDYHFQRSPNIIVHTHSSELIAPQLCDHWLLENRHPIHLPQWSVWTLSIQEVPPTENEMVDIFLMLMGDPLGILPRKTATIPSLVPRRSRCPLSIPVLLYLPQSLFRQWFQSIDRNRVGMARAVSEEAKSLIYCTKVISIHRPMLKRMMIYQYCPLSMG